MDFRPFISVGHIFRGGYLADQGNFHDGISELREGISSMRLTRTKYTLPLFQAWLGELYLKANQIEDGTNAIEEGLASANEDGDRFSLPEFHRIRGQLLLARSVKPGSGEEEEAETAFRKAMQIARAHQAKSPELRSTVCLASLWRAQGKRVEARELLRPIYDWHTEGFDTVDLTEAKALLDDLN